MPFYRYTVVLTATGFTTIGYVSSTTISGGSIKGTWSGDGIDDAYLESGTQYQDTYQWMVNSGQNYTNANDWYEASAQALSAYQASGDEYSAAYASAQALKEHSFHTLISSSYLTSSLSYTSLQDWQINSGQALSDTYIWYSASSSIISTFVASGDAYTSNYIWYNASANRLSELLASGTKYTQAYMSAQIAMYKLSHGDDVADITGKSDGDVLTWDTTQSKWSSQTVSGAPGGNNHYIQFNNSSS